MTNVRGSVAALDALRPLLRPGVRLSRLRLLEVVCPNDHRLCQVLPTVKGPLLLTKLPSGLLMDKEARLRLRGGFHARLLDEDAGDLYSMQCNCIDGQVSRAWLNEQIAGRKRRVVWTGATV